MKISTYVRPAYSARRLTGSWPWPPRLFDRPTGLQGYEDSIEVMELADELGFDWVSVAEHHYSGALMSPNPLILGSYLVTRLKRAKIAVLGPITSVVNPVRLAEELAMLDNLSGGRIVVGFVRGTPNEFQTYGVNPGETRDKFLEGMEIVMKAWTEPEPFGWQGRHYEYRQVSVWPRPQQQPRPPVYVLGSSNDSCEFAARNHLGIGFSHDRFEIIEESTHYYREQCAKADWQPEKDSMLFLGTVYVAETKAAANEYLDDIQKHGAMNPLDRPPIARRIAAEIGRLDPSKRDPMSGLLDPNSRPAVNFAGTPDDVIAEISRCRQMLGVGVLDLVFAGADREGVMRNMRLFAKEVLPCIRDV